MKAKKLFYTAILVFTSTLTQTSAQNSNPWPTTGPVGIGTSSPNSNTLLHVNNGSVLFSGTTGNSPISGAGTRLIWVPSKAAFRAGELSSTNGTHWDDANIGLRSVAVGYDAQASGVGSIALGSSVSAQGSTSFAVGWFSGAIGAGSTSIGQGTFAQSYGSVALGTFNLYSGSQTTWVSSDPIFVLGNGQDINTRSNAITILKDGRMGLGTTAPGSLLSNTSVTDGNVTANGLTWLTSNTDNYVTYLKTARYGLHVKTTDGTSASFPLFISANGSNLLAVKGDGNTGIGTLNPGTTLVVQSASNPTLAYFNKTGAGAQSPAIELQSNGITGLKFSHANYFAEGWIDNNYSSASNLIFALRGVEKVRIENDGSVGIATGSTIAPGYKLHAPNCNKKRTKHLPGLIIGQAKAIGAGYDKKHPARGCQRETNQPQATQ